jgi:O-Antigen ligase
MMSLAYAAVWLFVFVLPWENVIVLPGLGTISKLMGMVALGLAMLAAVVSGRLRRWRLFHVSAALFVIWAGWGLYWGKLRSIGDIDLVTDKFRTYVQLFLVLWMMWELSTTVRRQRGLFLAYVLGCYIAAINTIMVYRTEVGIVRRFAAQGFDPNDLAMTVALGIPMAWYLSLTVERRALQWVARLYLPLAIIVLGLTGSRGGMVAGIVALSVIPLTMVRLTPRRMAAGIVMIAASGVLAVAYVPQTALERLASTGQQVEEGNLNGRMRIWKAGLQALEEKPLLGHGTGAYNLAALPYLGYRRPAHNSYLSVMVEQGLLGFFLYMTMFFSVYAALRRLPLVERRFGLVLLATLLIAMLPLSWEDRKPVWFILAALLGLAEAILAARRTAAQPMARPRPPIVRQPLGPRPRSRFVPSAPAAGVADQDVQA